MRANQRWDKSAGRKFLFDAGSHLLSQSKGGYNNLKECLPLHQPVGTRLHTHGSVQVMTMMDGFWNSLIPGNIFPLISGNKRGFSVNLSGLVYVPGSFSYHSRGTMGIIVITDMGQVLTAVLRVPDTRTHHLNICNRLQSTVKNSRRHQISFSNIPFTSASVIPRYRIVIRGFEWLNLFASTSKPTPYTVLWTYPNVFLNVCAP